jgi:hypothetical protein
MALSALLSRYVSENPIHVLFPAPLSSTFTPSIWTPKDLQRGRLFNFIQQIGRGLGDEIPVRDAQAVAAVESD